MLLALATLLTAPAHAFDFESLKRLIIDERTTELSDVVGKLPADLRRNSTFVFESGGDQQADPLKPRAILWSEPGKFALAFNGGQGQLNGNTLEMWQYSSSEKRFHFYRLSFPLNRRADGRPDVQVEEPKLCLSCHGQNPRPIWSEYPTWPGTYGSDDDFAPAANKESERYKAFADSAMKHPRYAPLFAAKPANLSVADQPFYPYRFDQKADTAAESLAFYYRPNLRFSVLLTRLNVERVFEQIRKNPLYARERDKWLAGFLNCPRSMSFDGLLKETGVSKRDLDPRYMADDSSSESITAETAYFDGAATVNEYLASLLFADAAASRPELKAAYAPKSFNTKYRSRQKRNLLDRPYFNLMDALDAPSSWIAIPYPKGDFKKRHRSIFMPQDQEAYEAACAALGAPLTPSSSK